MRARLVFMTDASPPQITRMTDDSGRIGWRMLAANNRPMGRASRVHTTLDECVESAHAVKDAARRGLLEGRLSNDTGRWRWAAFIGSRRVAVSAVSYSRRSECVRALAQFTGAAGIVVVTSDSGDIELQRVGPRLSSAFGLSVNLDSR